MKTIVVSGACSRIGKTTLAKSICDILPQATFVKIGTGKRKESCPDTIYPHGTSFEKIRNNHAGARFLIIESNHILTELEPDLCIYLDGQPEKASAALAKQKADLWRGLPVSEDKLRQLTQRLDITSEKMKQICLLARVNPNPVSAIILAGGESSRMGKNKALLTLHGKALINHLYDTLIPHVDEVIISIAEKKELMIPPAPLVVDIIPGKGPLMGIYSAMCASSSFVNFVIACDIPVINVPLVKELLSYSFLYDIVVPSFGQGTYEPLFAVYTKRIITPAKTLLDNDQRRVASLFSLCKTKIMETTDKEWYANLNTPQDYTCFIEKVPGAHL